MQWLCAFALMCMLSSAAAVRAEESAPPQRLPEAAETDHSPPIDEPAAAVALPTVAATAAVAGAVPMETSLPVDAPVCSLPTTAGRAEANDADPRDLADDPFGMTASAVPARLPAIAQPPRFANVWQRLKSGFSLPALDDALVRKWENFYAERPDYWQRINERGKRYLYFVAREIERRGMPLEIALLPVIESAYNPEALSRARALGIWQFVPATGKFYGLAQNWWMDNRRDVGVATASALDYLEKLHDMFGDWQLALAAYNWGEGAVQRAVNRNKAQQKPVDYASLQMPMETRNYLPKLQAIKNIVMAPEKFGLSLPDVPDASYFVTVTTERHIDLALAAKLADVSLEDFKILNPAYNRPVIASAGEQRINLPSGKAETFLLNLDAYRQPLLSWRPYQVKSGERLDKIAPQFGIDLAELKRVNGLTGRKRIVPGFTLLVPAKSGAAPDAIPTAAFHDAPNDLPAFHRVRRGETVARIAERYGLTLAELKRLNALTANAVGPGRRLRLHDGASLPSAKAKLTKAVYKKRVTAKRRR